MHRLALLLALSATPALAQVSRFEDVPPHGIARLHGLTEPVDLMRVALANCMLWSPGLASEELNRGGWTAEHDEVSRLARGEVTVALIREGDWCTISSPAVTQAEARAIAEELGCAVLSPRARPEARVTLSGLGSDESSCLDDGQPGASLNFHHP